MSLDSEWQEIKCLTLAIAGSNGKSTTAALLERTLSHNDRRTLVCGHDAQPIASVAEQGNDLDFLILKLDSCQLRACKLLRPTVAVLLNLAADPLAEYGDVSEFTRAHAVLFQNQQFCDWAIIQKQALERLCELRIPTPAKTITFSATDSAADLFLDRGLLVSRLPNWSGPLLDLDH